MESKIDLVAKSELINKICQWLNDRLPGNPKYKPEFEQDVTELCRLVMPLVIADGGYIHVVDGKLSDDTVKKLKDFFDSCEGDD